MSAEEAFARAENVTWPALPEDEEIDYSDIPPQDFSGSDAVRGKYLDLALAARGYVLLDPDVRREFQTAAAVNAGLRKLIHRKRAS